MRHVFDLERIGAGLPVAGSRGELEAAAARGAMVVTAPPGTGKTTFVPPLVASLVPGRVLLTQPRRVAVRAAARRIAGLDGSALGGPVGFTVRGERMVGDATRIEVVTPGVLLRRLLADPALEGVEAVVLDEVHERSVDGDLLLGMLAEVRELRDDLLLVAMSATLDAGAVAALLGHDDRSGAAEGTVAAIVKVPAALHPLVVEHAPAPGPRLGLRGVPREFLDHVARTAIAEQARDGADALVFVPTARDVDEVVRRIRDRSDVEALPLHGRLPAAQQDRATAGRGVGDPPRIVVTTALAESSLTVPGVRLVVDAGLARETRRDAARDMTGLVTVSASRDSLEQRAGRAARQGPGRAVRLFTEAEQAAFPRSGAPEIASADLTDAALLLAAWGTPAATGCACSRPRRPPRWRARRRPCATSASSTTTDASPRWAHEFRACPSACAKPVRCSRASPTGCCRARSPRSSRRWPAMRATAAPICRGCCASCATAARRALSAGGPRAGGWPHWCRVVLRARSERMRAGARGRCPHRPNRVPRGPRPLRPPGPPGPHPLPMRVRRGPHPPTPPASSPPWPAPTGSPAWSPTAATCSRAAPAPRCPRAAA
ncbi:hypothetical protein GCM10025874_21820 [Arenivirga flava]|uniref:ATP-dependent helicase HrpB n=1 Tax=Arenivirga flava TaxID=1930060 RepID=A0AA37UEV1_9MICO|nr:hypothetical protein GCM10025874_21820 [Arenivirga flava]